MSKTLDEIRHSAKEVEYAAVLRGIAAPPPTWDDVGRVLRELDRATAQVEKLLAVIRALRDAAERLADPAWLVAVADAALASQGNTEPGKVRGTKNAGDTVRHPDGTTTTHKQGCPALGGYGTSDRTCICKGTTEDSAR